MIKIPQIQSTMWNLIAIAVVTVGCGVFNASIHGEIHGWRNLLQALNDGLLYGVVLACGWLGMKSSLAKTVAGLLQQEATKTTTEHGGKKTVETTKTSIQVETESDKSE